MSETQRNEMAARVVCRNAMTLRSNGASSAACPTSSSPPELARDSCADSLAILCRAASVMNSSEFAIPPELNRAGELPGILFWMAPLVPDSPSLSRRVLAFVEESAEFARQRGQGGFQRTRSFSGRRWTNSAAGEALLYLPTVSSGGEEEEQ